MSEVPQTWDNRAGTIASEIRGFLKTIVDEGSAIDSGMGDNLAELWPHIDGIEYHVVITVARELPRAITPSTDRSER